MDNSIEISVIGLPAPQGSKQYVGHGNLIESSPKVQPWRSAVAWACKQASLEQGWPQTDLPVSLEILFLLPRPRGHFGKNGLRRNAPYYPYRKPDLDKLLRATADGITDSNCIYSDDARIVSCSVKKLYADVGQELGARISVSILGDYKDWGMATMKFNLPHRA